MMPLDSEWYALIPSRCWYAPWLWNVHAISNKGFFDSPAKPMLSKVRRDEAYGLMKILGAYNLEN